MEEGSDDYVHDEGVSADSGKYGRSSNRMEAMEEAHVEFQFGNDVEVEVITDDSSSDEDDDDDDDYDNKNNSSKSFWAARHDAEQDELNHVFHEERLDNDDGVNLHEQPRSPAQPRSPLQKIGSAFSIFRFPGSPKDYNEVHQYSAPTPSSKKSKTPKRGSQGRSPKCAPKPTSVLARKRNSSEIVKSAWFRTWDEEISFPSFCLRETKEVMIGFKIMLCCISPLFLLLATMGVLTGVIYIRNGILGEHGLGVPRNILQFIGIAFATMVVGFLFMIPASFCFDASKRLFKHRERESIGFAGWLIVFLTALAAIGFYVGTASAGIAAVLKAYYADLDFSATVAFVALARTIEGFTLAILNPLSRWSKKFDEKGFEIRVWRLPFVVELMLLMLGGSAAGVSAYLTVVSSGLFLAIPHGAWLAAGLGCTWQASILPVLMVFTIQQIRYNYQSHFEDAELLSLGIHPAE